MFFLFVCMCVFIMFFCVYVFFCFPRFFFRWVLVLVDTFSSRFLRLFRDFF